MRPFERLRYQVTLRLARRRSSCYFQRDAPRLLVEGGQPQLVHCPSGITEQYNPSRKVLQFPDVPRPLMGSQEFSFLVAQRRSLPSYLLSMFRQKMLHEGEDVLLPVSQRREAEANSIDSKIQFRPKPPQCDFFLQAAQRRRDDAKGAGSRLVRLSLREEFK